MLLPIISTIAVPPLVSVIISTLVNWFVGPWATLRQDAARRRVELLRRLRLILEQLERHLRNEQLRRQRLEQGGQAAVRLTIRNYEELLWPVVRAFSDPDLGRCLARKHRAGLRDLLGSYRLEYLEICEDDQLENALERYAIQPPEQRHLEEPIALLPALFTNMGDTRLAIAASARVRRLIKVVR